MVYKLLCVLRRILISVEFVVGLSFVSAHLYSKTDGRRSVDTAF